MKVYIYDYHVNIVTEKPLSMIPDALFESTVFEGQDETYEYGRATNSLIYIAGKLSRGKNKPKQRDYPRPTEQHPVEEMFLDETGVMIRNCFESWGFQSKSGVEVILFSDRGIEEDAQFVLDVRNCEVTMSEEVTQ